MKKQIREVKFDLSQVTLRLASIDDKEVLKRMFKSFAKDLWSQYREMLSIAEHGNVCNEKLETTIIQMLCKKKLFVAHAENEKLGFLVISSNEFKGTYIDLAYVRPNARRIGVGSRLYNLAMREHGATAIQLMYRRVHRKWKYWREVGFNSITFQGSSGYGYGCIVRLSTEQSPSIMSCELDAKQICALRKKLQQPQAQLTPLDSMSSFSSELRQI